MSSFFTSSTLSYNLHPIKPNTFEKILHKIGNVLFGTSMLHAQPTRPADLQSTTTTMGPHLTAAKGTVPDAGRPASRQSSFSTTSDIHDTTAKETAPAGEQGMALKIDSVDAAKQDHAADVIKRAIRNFKKRRDQIAPNKFGIKIMENHHPVGNQKQNRRCYYFGEQGRRLATEKGEDHINPGMSGHDKTCVRVNDNETLSFILKKIPDSNNAFTFPAFFNELDCLVFPRRVTENRLIIPYAGIKLTDHQGPLAIHAFEKLVTQLDHMHRRHYCHLDIKPDNLCIKGDLIKLIDCDGIDRTISDESLVCTPGFMPEPCAQAFLNDKLDLKKSSTLKVLMDNYAMLYSMILATRTDLGLTKSEQKAFDRAIDALSALNEELVVKPNKLKKFDIGVNKYPSKEKVLKKQLDTMVYVRNNTSVRFIDRWIDRHVKPEHRQKVALLLSHPMLYLDYYPGQAQALHEMLDWSTN